jgi:hypothetical protein
MATKLEELLAAIHPSRTLDAVSARVDRAAASFVGTKAQVTDFEEYQELIGRFFAHVESEVLGTRTFWPDHKELYVDRAQQLLNQAYGASGWKAAFEIARTGVEGGMRQVLATLAERMALMYARNEIHARVAVFWNEASPDEWLAASEEYLAKFGHLLPSELTERGAWRIKGNFQDVLNEHPFMLRRLSRLGR